MVGSLKKFGDLAGKKIASITHGKDKNDNSELIFCMENRELYKLYHEQDCCESVWVEDIVGDIKDIIGEKILIAEEVTNRDDEKIRSRTWTFYKLATAKGYVTFRWYGESNGYYSESVNWSLVK